MEREIKNNGKEKFIKKDSTEFYYEALNQDKKTWFIMIKDARLFMTLVLSQGDLFSRFKEF